MKALFIENSTTLVNNILKAPALKIVAGKIVFDGIIPWEEK